MNNTDFIALKDFVIDKNRYFSQAFANVYLEENTGLIYNGDSGDRFAVGINDQFGNYFYIRTDADIRYTLSRPQLSDSGQSLDEMVKCYLVAVVEDADPKQLVQCLLNSLLQYGSERIRPMRAIYIREVAVAKELAKIEKEDLAIVLANLGSLQVVMLEFDFTTKFSPAACPCSPCKSCSDE